MKALSSSWNS